MTRLSVFGGPWDIWPWKVGCYYRNSPLSDRIHYILCLVRCSSYFRFCIWKILSFHFLVHVSTHCSFIPTFCVCFINLPFNHIALAFLSFFFFIFLFFFGHLMSHVFILPFIHFVSCFIHCFLNVCCIVCLFVCLQVFPRRIYHRYMVLIVHLYEIAADTSHNRTSLQGQVNTVLS